MECREDGKMGVLLLTINGDRMKEKIKKEKKFTSQIKKPKNIFIMAYLFKIRVPIMAQQKRI